MKCLILSMLLLTFTIRALAQEAIMGAPNWEIALKILAEDVSVTIVIDDDSIGTFTSEDEWKDPNSANELCGEIGIVWVANTGDDWAGGCPRTEIPVNTLTEIVFEVDSGDGPTALSYNYFQCEEGFQEQDFGHFLCPNAVGPAGNNNDLYFIVTATGGWKVEVYGMNELAGIEAVVESNGWLIPHNLDQIDGCDQGCQTSVSYWLSPQSPPTFDLADLDLTVPSSRTWIFEDVNLNFENGRGVIVEGEFNASGSTFSAIGSTWDGIRYENGSSGTITGSTIEDVGYESDAIYIEDASPAIWGNDITSAGNGIWIEGSSANPVIEYNTITVGSSGVVSYGGQGYVSSNTITGSLSGSGIGAGNGGDPILGPEELGPGYNVVSGFYWGLNALSGSTIWSQGYDCISDISSAESAKHLRAVASSDVVAENDWWGGSDPRWEALSGGTVDWTPRYVGSCPASGASKTRSPLVLSSAAVASDDLSGRLLKARILREEGKLDEAISEYMTLIEYSPRSAQAGSALLDLGRLARRTVDARLAKYLEDQAGHVSVYRLHILGMLIGYYLGAGDDVKALDTARLVADEGAGTWHAFSANWQAYRIHAGAERWTDAADALSEMQPFNEFDEHVLERMEAQLSEAAPGEYARLNESSTRLARSGEETINVSAYPNPFNPTTSISFDLVLDSDVRVVVYDVLGREMAVLANGRLLRGRHAVSWDAVRLPSGVYFAVVVAGGRRAAIPITLLN